MRIANKFNTFHILLCIVDLRWVPDSCNNLLFLDTSTGLNEYVNALITAASHFIVSQGLRHINPENNIEVYRIISDPVIGNPANDGTNPYNVYISKMHRIVFFSLPYKENKLEKINAMGHVYYNFIQFFLGFHIIKGFPVKICVKIIYINF